MGTVTACRDRFAIRADSRYMGAMKIFLVLLLIAAMIATVVALVRGIVTFLRTSEAELKGEGGPAASSLKSNKMMQQRIIFQGIAIAIVALILLLASDS